MIQEKKELIGIDGNLEVSLFEYGFVWEKELDEGCRKFIYKERDDF